MKVKINKMWRLSGNRQKSELADTSARNLRRLKKKNASNVPVRTTPKPNPAE